MEMGGNDVAIYCRLSKEDEKKIHEGDESESIQNQKLLLLEYARKQQFDVYEIYIDDDYSGTDSERPAFKRLIRDAKKGLFGTVICKSLSRFTRDMEYVEKYIHGLLPILGIRFIGVIDHVDTNDKSNKKARQIYGLINEWYVEDLSENIRGVFQSKMKEGQFLGAFAPYGYKKSQEDKHKLVIDEPAARVVKKIFQYSLQGLGIQQICSKLYEEHSLPPSVYKKNNTGDVQNEYWSHTSVKRILKDKVYLGVMIQHKAQRQSYKSKKIVMVPKEEWIVVEDCHDAIVDAKTFDLVQKGFQSRRTPYKKSKTKEGEVHILSGKVRCMDCGATMIRNRCRSGRSYFYCSRYCRSKKEDCSLHSIDVEVVKQELEHKIYGIINLFLKDKDNLKAMTEELGGKDFYVNRRKRCQAELGHLFAHIEGNKKALTQVYIDKVNSNLNEEEYWQIKNNIDEKMIGEKNRVNQLEEELEKFKKKENTSSKKEELLTLYLLGKELSRNLVNAFVDYIEINDKKKEREQKIVIHWNF